MFASAPTDKSRFDAELVAFIPDLTHPVRNRNVEIMLKSNAPPSRIEEESLLSIVRRGDAVIADLERRIKATQDALDFLVKEKDQAISNVEDAQSLLHSSRKLNEELLRRIFKRCVDSQPTGTDSLDSRSCPWNLSQVCKEWRRVAMHTPEVWSRISLSFSTVADEADDAMRSFMLGLCLGRALNHPLSLRIDSARDISKHQLFWMLVPTASRWREVDFDMPYEAFQALSPYKGFLGGLKYLSVSIRGLIPEGSGTIDAFCMTSQLQELRATGIDQPFKVFDLDGGRILRFEALDGTTDDHHLALKSMPSIQSLEIQCDKSKTDAMAILSNLQNLGITERFSIDHGRGSAAQFMRCAEMPALETLRMSLVPTAGPVFPAAAPYPITTLDISCRLSRPQDYQEFVHFLWSLKQLENLIIGADDIPAAFFKTLVYSQRGNKGTNVLPRLQRIDLHRSTLEDGDEAMNGLLSLISSRRTGSAGRTIATPRRAKRMSTLAVPCALLHEVCLEAPLVVEHDQVLLNQWKELCEKGLSIVYKNAEAVD
ncbi:hypothetical protein IW261DRAFT_1466253 [Armillaria novae-zelandiae]|uniref:F-box domain-containing protein n=1 Tax=Armillaria novae-zelandiae TaxID=153914 RepID=A0AA39TEJ4_9AGAR|nr:hypothetical protein IW261DRAFT_1466253 [Armillaria novae-zelandiae]